MSNSVYREPRAWLLTLGTFVFVVLWCDLGIEREKEEIRDEITFLEKKISKVKKQRLAENQSGLPSALDS
ncbi:hypothetical protein GpartN1_g2147.t1 [Galdieria partita]|uniref:Uncharacterized protein n=1 Tax=Galdieria partita TaxID=83374 RepID=A0A9C7PTT2_9RHOD|nr:hypothetical protein GpartN1_g2147.t1 [Galdieria partita]